MSSFKTEDVLAACVTFGPQLRVPAGLDPIRVMKAIASNESSLGANCGPRHEPAYEATGAPWAQHAMAPLLALYPPQGDPPQSPAAMSYGPWQMMFCNFQRQYAPRDLQLDLNVCASEFVRFFNAYVIESQTARTLAQIGEVWNMGHIAPDPNYVNKLKAAYDAASSD